MTEYVKTFTIGFDSKSSGVIYKGIKKNSIECVKKDDSNPKTSVIEEDLLETTLQIGYYVEDNKILKNLVKDSNASLLNSNRNIFYDFKTIDEIELKQIIEIQIQKLKEILENPIITKNGENNGYLLKEKNINKKFYNLIQKWFDNYGHFLITTGDVQQYYDLYDFLEFAHNYYLMSRMEIEMPDVSLRRILLKEEGVPEFCYKYETLFDYILSLVQLTITGYYHISYCEYCGVIFVNRKSDKKTCSNACKTAKSRKKRCSK